MTPRFSIRFPSSKPKPQSPGESSPDKARGDKTKRLGEVAGGTAAGCAAVCCCCPFTLMNFLVLAVFKVPACLCKKAKRRRRLKKKKKMQALLSPGPSCSRNDLCIETLERKVRGGDGRDDAGIEAVDLEKEMWDRFFATGFWRSPSQSSRV
ncbi:uncharacterized protein LOC126674173 [Mercurialis annua]|uniref:uncharacterized protein LOC126674173 n=1 Tax=Mercurialis annua TaxID=3986 RepID=UPI00215E9488|nr:uncharacterized protein LOC126674173 [Mercurialis annua]